MFIGFPKIEDGYTERLLSTHGESGPWVLRLRVVKTGRGWFQAVVRDFISGRIVATGNKDFSSKKECESEVTRLGIEYAKENIFKKGAM